MRLITPLPSDSFQATREGADWLTDWRGKARGRTEELPLAWDRANPPQLADAIWKSYKDVLHEAGGAKCMYCESPGELGALQVDHYRPLRGNHKTLASCDRQSHTGYYWLAYKEENFVLTCQPCNRAKSNSFPIEGKRCYDREIGIEALDAVEMPLIVNPFYIRSGNDWRRTLLSWCDVMRLERRSGEWVPHDNYPQALSSLAEKALVTVKTLKLNRPGLRDQRRLRSAEAANFALGEFGGILKNEMSVMRSNREVAERQDLVRCLDLVWPSLLNYIGLKSSFSAAAVSYIEQELIALLDLPVVCEDRHVLA